MSASLQSLMGYVVGTRAIPYGVFTFGTGFDMPNGQGTYWQVTRTTRIRPTARRRAVQGELVIPGLNVGLDEHPAGGAGDASSCPGTTSSTSR